MSKTVIGMTDGRMYDLYANWLLSLTDQVAIVRLGYRFANLRDIEQCQGLVFTGGEDVHPSRYQGEAYLPYCVPEDFDIRRDEFEFQLLEHAVKRPLPILGICRGLQLVNVFFGGSLIPDLPRWGKFEHGKLPDGTLREHPVMVDPYSQLSDITGRREGMVNSLHHQSADKIGDGLVVAAISPDGVVEAIERKEKQGMPFLCLIQWHPERMADTDNPFVSNILTAFVTEAQSTTLA
ncbi:gamma-glutamyl-gamma-aminobutyrate hydrolase family protein [Parapedobacter sp. DT-150]|uniref:gamma-glutamyl-gamma-aminobutyrate hydrolase family protein n=1 Tax=Parapedobacter sp. DT-150 TaxID=3396162 RepID=UPI003F1B281C